MYKTYLYKILTFFTPDFDKYIVKKLAYKKNIKIIDVGFFKGTFAKNIISKSIKKDGGGSFTLYSFEPNENIDVKNFQKFALNKNIKWIHSKKALGENKRKDDFTILSSFPSSGSSIDNILENSLWFKTRKFIIAPFRNKNNVTNKINIEVDTLDNVFETVKDIDLIKIDVEGYGYKVLEGSKNYLKNNSPIIQVEILSKKSNFHFQENQIYEYLNGLNYQLVGRKKHYTTHLFSDVVCVDYLFEKIL